MGKKKGRRQSDPSRDECESTDEETVGLELEVQSSCPHTGKAVSLGCIKKNLKIAWVRVGQCAVCLREKKMSSRPATLPRGKTGAKKTLQDVKNEQLERARQEQINAAQKLKQLSSMEDPVKEGVADTNKGVADTNKGVADTNKGVADTNKGVADTNKSVADPALSSVWLCLKCGSQACDAKDKDHALTHYKTPRSELHCIFVNTETWTIFCHECNKDIFIDSHKKLYEAVEFIKKIDSNPSKHMTKTVMPSMSLPKLTGKELKDQTNVAVQAGQLPKVKGLNNLGNTCFFNSVMQCLSQTHPLTQLIDLQSTKGANFTTQVLECTGENTLSEDENDNIGSFGIPELSVQLTEGGPMMTSLAAFLKEMHSHGKATTISPSHLFGQVVKQSPKFRGMQQQDSQELLRYLMDGLRSEEVKRQKSAVLKYFGLSEKTDPEAVPKNVRKKLKLYGRTGNHTLLDKIFSGQMVSTVVCEECHYSSQTYESFLDLSLPVVEDKPHKPRARNTDLVLPDDDDEVRVTCCGVQEEKKSKGQIKKEKLKKKKETRRNRKDGKEEKKDDTKDDQGKMEESEQDALVKSVLKTAAESVIENKDYKSIPKIKSVKTETRPVQERVVDEGWKDGNEEDEEDDDDDDEDEDGWEWDYGHPTNTGETKSKENESDSDYIETGVEEKKEEVPSKPLQSLNPLPPQMINQFEHEKSSERTGENSENETGASSNADIEDNDSDESRKKWANTQHILLNLSKLDPVNLNPENLDPHMEELCRGIKLLNSTPENKDTENSDLSYLTADSEQKDSGDKPLPVDKPVPGDKSGKKVLDKEEQKLRLRNEWTARTLVSLAPRYESGAGECSLYSCFNQFTQSELLAGSNKWACQSCTKLRCSGDDSDDSEEKKKKPKTVYSNASKQFLIFCPPMILTIHLKRFQQTLMGCRKLNKHVTFPVLLDLAPFCSSTALSIPLMRPNQTKVLYSLYGVVEHSGRLQGGHYTAFVKVRPANTSNRNISDFFSPPLSRAEDISRFLAELQQKSSSKAPPAEPEVESLNQPRRWFHVSDTTVSEVAEEKVLKAQAYLLFYERVL